MATGYNYTLNSYSIPTASYSGYTGPSGGNYILWTVNANTIQAGPTGATTTIKNPLSVSGSVGILGALNVTGATTHYGNISVTGSINTSGTGTFGTVGTYSVNNAIINGNVTGSILMYPSSHQSYITVTGTNPAQLAIGGLIGNSGSSGPNNVFLGYNIAYNTLTSGKENVSIGISTFSTVTSGYQNITVGNGSGGLINTGYQNCMLGYNAGPSITSGNNQILIGYNCGAGLGGGNNCIGIGSSVGFNGGTNEIVIGSGVSGKGSNTSFITNTCYNGANTSTWAVSSDQRIKTNIIPLDSSINKINSLNPVSFTFKENGVTGIGFIAQQYQTIFPDQITYTTPNKFQAELIGVTGSSDDNGITYSMMDVKNSGPTGIMSIQENLIPYLVKAFQELNSKLNYVLASTTSILLANMNNNGPSFTKNGNSWTLTNKSNAEIKFSINNNYVSSIQINSNTTNTTTFTLDRSGIYNIIVGSNDSITINWNVPSSSSTITFANFGIDSVNTYTYTISIDASNNFTTISSTSTNIASNTTTNVSPNLSFISSVWTIIPT